MHKDIKYFGVYLLLAVIAYWQVSFFQNTLKWDMIDCYLPWRSFVSECIQNGHFPLWNPYQNFGYPIHADMRSIWAPEIYLVSLLGGYSNYTFHVLFIAYTTIAGIGMYYLSNLFLKNSNSAFLSGAIYMLSGYLTSHGQEIYTINSFAFIPLVLYHFIQLNYKPTFKRASYLTLFLFIILTSAYQAHSFILLYLFIIIYGYFIYNSYRKSNKIRLKKTTFLLATVAFILLVIFIPYIVSLKQVLPFVSRLNSGVGASSTSILPFSPQSLLSLILPFASVRNIEFFNTDLSMTNLYFGIIPLVFLVVFFTKRYKNTVFTIVFVFGIFSLLASFGDYTPLRKLLYNYVPFMNLFKGSAYFRLFTLIGFCIAAAYAVLNLIHKKKAIIIISFVLIALLIAFIIHSFPQIYFRQNSFINQEFNLIQDLISKSTYYENIFIQALIQIVFLSLLILLFIVKKASFNNIMRLIIINLIIAVQLNIYSTTVSQYSPTTIKKHLKTLPKGFPVPKNELISSCTDKSVSNSPLWRNTSTLAKQISGDSFNSFYLDKTADFKGKYKRLKDSVTSNHLLYFSNNILPLSSLTDSSINKLSLFIPDSSYNKHKQQSDTSKITNTSYKITSFGPNHIEATIQTDVPTFLTLIQTYYPGWQASINNKPVEIIESNTTFISIELSSGINAVKFHYENKLLVNTFKLSATLLIFLVLLVILFSVIDIRNKQKSIRV